MKDKLYQAYCIIGNRIWDYFNEREIEIRRGYVSLNTSECAANRKLEKIINDFGLKL